MFLQITEELPIIFRISNTHNNFVMSQSGHVMENGIQDFDRYGLRKIFIPLHKKLCSQCMKGKNLFFILTVTPAPSVS